MTYTVKNTHLLHEHLGLLGLLKSKLIFGCLVRVHKINLVSLVLETLYSPLKHALGYLDGPRLLLII